VSTYPFRNAFLVFSVFAVILVTPLSLKAQQMQPVLTVVRVLNVNGRAEYTVDSHPVKDLLRAFNRLADRNGKNQPVLVQIDSRLPCAEIWNIDGVAGKAQLANVRFFIVFDESGMMSEINRLPAIPVSRAPSRR
jgi:hypothetical protein